MMGTRRIKNSKVTFLKLKAITVIFEPVIRRMIGSLNYYCFTSINIPVNVLTINTETYYF